MQELEPMEETLTYKPDAGLEDMGFKPYRNPSGICYYPEVERRTTLFGGTRFRAIIHWAYGDYDAVSASSMDVLVILWNKKVARMEKRASRMWKKI